MDNELVVIVYTFRYRPYTRDSDVIELAIKSSLYGGIVNMNL